MVLLHTTYNSGVIIRERNEYTHLGKELKGDAITDYIVDPCIILPINTSMKEFLKAFVTRLYP